MSKRPTTEELLKAGVHFGHQSSRWHPKMKPFIFGVRNGIHIIDLDKTAEQLDKALNMVTEITARGGQVMFLGTKPQMKGYVRDAAERCGMPHVADRWLGGTITNFEEISKLIKRRAELKSQMDSGEIAKKYNKREQLTFSRELDDLEARIGGLKTMSKLPEAVIVFDVRNEMTAVREAMRQNIPVIAICDTNVNPGNVTLAVPANDDAVKSIELMTNAFADAVLEGAKNVKAAPKAAAAKAKKEVAIK